MRIISGTHKGRILTPPKNLPVRPTTDRAKEALFSIIDNRYFFEEKNMLDLFSGTGSIAFEFASRGTQNILAIDNNNACIEFIKLSAKEFDLDVSALHSDSLTFALNCKKKFNFIFADPPYNYTKYNELKEIIIKNNLIKKDGLLIIEHDKNTVFNDNNMEVRKYGSVHFSLFSF